MSSSIQKYAAVFGRAPAVVREPEREWGVSACMFPPMKRSFWRSLIAEAHDQTVYITAGMSNHAMPSDAEARKAYPDRVELMAFSEFPIGGGESGREDVPTAILQMIADYILHMKILVGLGHTLDFQELLAPNTQMSAVLFLVPEHVDSKRIRRCTKAKELLNVMPITAAEVDLARKDGVLALIDKFEEGGVLPVFDYWRKSVV